MCFFFVGDLSCVCPFPARKVSQRQDTHTPTHTHLRLEHTIFQALQNALISDTHTHTHCSVKLGQQWRVGFNAEHIRSKTDLHIHVGGYQTDTHAHINNMHVHTRLNLSIPHVCPHTYNVKSPDGEAEREAWRFPPSGSHGGHLCCSPFNSHSETSLFFSSLCRVTYFPAFSFH